MKTIKYTICDASGKVQSCTIPTVFGPYDVAKRLPHSMVFYHVRKGTSVQVDHNHVNLDTTVHGPAVVYVMADESLYAMPKAPETDSEALYLWKNYGPDQTRPPVTFEQTA